MKEQILFVAFLCLMVMSYNSSLNSSHIYLNVTDDSRNYTLILDVYSQNVTVNLTEFSGDGNSTIVGATGIVDMEYFTHITNETNQPMPGKPANTSG